jgi:hypothetical protein
MHAHVQRLVSVDKMATVLEECATEEQLFFFLWTKGLSVKDIHKEMLPVYSGKFRYSLHLPIWKCLRSILNRVIIIIIKI